MSETEAKTETEVPMMDAVIYNAYGGPEVMEIGKLPIPTPGPKQIIVKVSHASVNPIDVHLRSGAMKAMSHTPFPHGLAYDVSGTVHAVGSEVTAFKIGEHIFSRIREQGTLAQYCRADEDVVAKRPTKISAEHAAAAPLTALTALQGLKRGGLVEGQKVFISGGGGGVGTFAIQLAKHVFKAGEVVTTASAGKKTDLCKSLGADRVVNYREEKFEDVLEHQSFDVVFDTTGEAARMGALVKPGGKVMSISGALTSEALVEIGVKPNIIVRAILWKMARATRSALKKHGATYDFFFLKTNGKELAEIGGYMSDGKVKAVIDSVHKGLSSYKDAYERLESNRAAGKVVVAVE